MTASPSHGILGAVTEPVRTGAEPFHVNGVPLPRTLLDFWKWTGSLLLNNTSRGNLAEFIVAQALGVDRGVRATWDSYDLLFADRLKIEVKSSAYVQAWHQERLCKPTFGIGPAKGWDATTNRYSERRRHAHVYVFCLLHHTDQDTIDPLDMGQWTFLVLSARVLEERCPAQKSLGLGTLQRLGAERVSFTDLRSVIERHDAELAGTPFS
jgi:hypothetical protein